MKKRSESKFNLQFASWQHHWAAGMAHLYFLFNWQQWKTQLLRAQRHFSVLFAQFEQKFAGGSSGSLKSQDKTGWKEISSCFISLFNKHIFPRVMVVGHQAYSDSHWTVVLKCPIFFSSAYMVLLQRAPFLLKGHNVKAKNIPRHLIENFRLRSLKLLKHESTTCYIGFA